MKRILCIVLVLLFCVLQSVSGFAEAKSLDVNQDGATNAVDALLVLQHAVGKVQLTQEQKLLADGDENGVIDAADALLILQYSVKPPQQFPQLPPDNTVAFTPFGENHRDHYVATSGDYFNRTVAVVCNSPQEVQQALTDSLQISPNQAEGLLAPYSQDYFQANSLLLVGIFSGDSTTQYQVSRVEKIDGHLHLTLNAPFEHNTLPAIENRVYAIELTEKVDSAMPVVCTVESVGSNQE